MLTAVCHAEQSEAKHLAHPATRSFAFAQDDIAFARTVPSRPLLHLSCFCAPLVVDPGCSFRTPFRLPFVSEFSVPPWCVPPDFTTRATDIAQRTQPVPGAAPPHPRPCGPSIPWLDLFLPIPSGPFNLSIPPKSAQIRPKPGRILLILLFRQPIPFVSHGDQRRFHVLIAPSSAPDSRLQTSQGGATSRA